MKRFLLFLLVAAGLTLTAAGCSSNYSHYPYPQGGPGGYYGGGYGNGYGNQDRVRQLAYDLERTTESLKQEAKNSRVNDHVVDQLEDLDDKAGDFRHEVEERDARGMSNEFQNVSREYYQTRDALQRYSGYGYDSYGSQYLYRDLQRVGSIMSELSRYYSTYGRY